MISWKSTDGTVIEGVLHKPADFQPGRKYPLLVIIHGGPTGISRPVRVQMGGVYPVEQWLAKGALVLEPNYRGSAGYGEKFRSLNVRNLGVGDAWDVLSGVDHLVAQGLGRPRRAWASWAGARAATSRRSSRRTSGSRSRRSRSAPASRTG
jgi:dipeptidyl aminopeptidase/acylaminoacyl peptidase